MLITGLVLMAASVAAQQNTTEVTFSLEECINYALENNETLRNTQLDKDIAQARVRETLADGLPQLNANLELAYNYKIAVTPLPDFIAPSVYGVLFDEALLEPRDLGPPDIIPTQFGTDYTGQAVISLEQMLFDGSYFVGLRAARTYTELSRKDHLKSEIDIVEAVSKAYYSLLVNKEQTELINKNYERLDSLLRDTKGLYENGFAEKIEVNRVQVQFNNAKVERDNMDQLIEISKILLKFQMGLPQSSELEISETIEDIRFESMEINENDDFDYSQRIEYSQLQTNETLAQLDMKNTQVQYYPKVDLFGNFGSSMGAISSGDIFNFDDNWFGLGAIGVRMSVPIFDGFRKSNIIQQKRLQVAQINNNKKQLENNIDLEVRQSSLTYDRSIDNMVAQQENMKLAEEVYNVAKVKYEEGLGSSLEIINADADYKEAQTNYYSALYDALVAKVELQKAYGTLYK